MRSRNELRAPAPAIPFIKTPPTTRRLLICARRWEYDAFLHIQARHGNHDHKLELLDTADKSLDQMMSAIARVTEEHPDELSVRRVDLCADIPEGPVDFFARSIRAQWKRFQSELGDVELNDKGGQRVGFMEIGKKHLETIYFGKRSANPYRVYDKTAERMHCYEQARRRHYREAAATVTDAVLDNAQLTAGTPKELTAALRKRLKPAASRMYPFPSFEVWSGLESSAVLTRVERQMQGKTRRLSSGRIRTLRQNVVEFNPFERLSFATESHVSLEVSPDDFSPVEWLAGVKMWELLESGEWNMHQLYQFLNRDA